MDLNQILQKIKKLVELPIVNQVLCELQGTRGPAPKMAIYEILAIFVYYHQCGKYKNFKKFYCDSQKNHKGLFRNLLSFGRFVSWIPRLYNLLDILFKLTCGAPTGVSFIDSTVLPVCKPSRIKSNRVFKSVAKRGRTWAGYFFLCKIFASLLAYNFRETKPNVAVRSNDGYVAYA